MSDLIKSITTNTISVNDVFEEAFEAAVETTPGNNDLILSYNPVSQTIGKSTFPADATAIAVEAKTEAATAQQTATSANVATQQLAQDLAASKIISVDSTNKTVTFTGQKYIRQFTVTSDYTPVIDFTNAQIGCGTVLNILQTNGAKVLWPANVKPRGYPLADQNGVVNTYYLMCEDIDKYRYIRTVDSADFPVDDTNPAPVVVGTTIVTAGTIDQTTAVINYTAADNATGYKVEKYLNSDFSDAPIIIQSSKTDLTETLTGLIANTDYYIKVTPFAGSVLGTPGTIYIKTMAAVTYSTYSLLDFSSGSDQNDKFWIYRPNPGADIVDGKLTTVTNNQGEQYSNFLFIGPSTGGPTFSWPAGNYKISMNCFTDRDAIIKLNGDTPNTNSNNISIYNLTFDGNGGAVQLETYSATGPNATMRVSSILIEKQN